jgi:hypothetical protein
MPLDSKPNRCHSGRGATTFATGTDVLAVSSPVFVFGVVLVELCRLAKFVWVFLEGGFRKTARLAALVLNKSIGSVVIAGTW